jgi:hypothetical protein
MSEISECNFPQSIVKYCCSVLIHFKGSYSMKKQVFNPYLPIDEYIPDGEPHIFGDRVYIYGSHDKEGGYTFCMRDYVTYSAPLDDLSDWRFEGIIYRADQDPQYPNLKYMYAPDVVLGNDGKYYLYYAMGGDYGYGGYIGPISVAVADAPAGPYEFLGFVRNKDGSPMEKYVPFDPAVLNDNGTIRLYYGTQYGIDNDPEVQHEEEFEKSLMEMFGKTSEEIRSYPDNINGPIVCTLEDDMLTIKEEPKHLIPYHVKGTPFEDHAFFEASSMRKVGDKYYFVYSSWLNHELCYATSDYPDKDFVFGGTIVSNGDVGYEGREAHARLNMTGTTHGSIIEINGQWYVFYHRLTHKSDYSRQSCAEKITILPDGSIPQVQMTSCGLNDGALKAEGTYPSVIACNITNGKMPYGSNSIYREPFPNVNNIGEERFIAEIEHGTLIGYKYFDLPEKALVKLTVREETKENIPVYDGPVRVDVRCAPTGEEKINYAHETDPVQEYFEVRLSEDGEAVGRVTLEGLDADWKDFVGEINVTPGVSPLYLVYHGKKKVQLITVAFE